MKYLAILLSMIFLISCEDDNDTSLFDFPTGSYYILNQGLWSGNDASLSVYDPVSDKLENNVFEQVNGYVLGDSGNDMFKIDDDIYILLAGSKLIVQLNSRNAEIIRSIDIPGSNWPHKMTHDELNIYVTDLYLNKVYVINMASGGIIKEIPTGPGPDGITVANNNIIVANSALGEVNDSVAGSRSLSVLDKGLMEARDTLQAGPNTRFVVSNGTSIFAGYSDFWSSSEIGGLIEYDINTLEKVNERRVDIQSNPIFVNDGLAFIGSSSAYYISNSASESEVLIENTNSSEFWTNIFYDTDMNEYWITNAMDYQTTGKVQVYNSNKELVRELETGLVPFMVVK